MLRIDLIGLLEARYAVSAAPRTAAGWTQVIAEAPRDTLIAFASTALVNCHVAEPLKECPVHSPEFLTALAALHSSLL